MSVDPVSAAWLERKARRTMGTQGSGTFPNMDAARGYVVLESDRPEYGFGAGEFLYAAGHGVSAVAGEFAHVFIENPEGSGILVIVERCFASGGVSGVILGLVTTAQAVERQTVVGVTRRDTRIQPSGVASAAKVWANTNVASLTGGTFKPSGLVENNSIFDAASPLILSEGFALVVGAQVVNEIVRATILWRERPYDGQLQ